MKLAPTTYVPVLKWRQGEYQALLRLSDTAKNQIVPLVTIPPIEFDFEAWVPKHTVQEHIAPFGRRFRAKWETRSAWVDFDPSLIASKMDNGLDVLTHVFSELRTFKARAVPIASLDHEPAIRAAVTAVKSTDKLGIGLRARLEHIMRPDFALRAAALLAELKADVGEVDLIIDLGTPAYEPYPVFAGALTAALMKIPNLSEYRSFVIIGTAFPESLQNIVPPGGKIERHDWRFYQSLIAMLPLSMRRPNFGDYTVVHPAFVAVDMRMVKPAAKIIYTDKLEWAVSKGSAFRDNPAQMHDLCAQLTKSAKFRGPKFSEGDNYIEQCARKKLGPSTQTRWKEVGISHHTMHVLEDLAKLGASP